MPIREIAPEDIVIQDRRTSHLIMRIRADVATSESIVSEVHREAAITRACLEARGHQVWLVDVKADTREAITCPNSPW